MFFWGEKRCFLQERESAEVFALGSVNAYKQPKLWNSVSH